MHLLRKLAHRPVSPISNGGDVCRPFNPPTTPGRPNGDDNHIPRHSAVALQPSSYGFVASLNWPVTAEHRIGLGNSTGRGPCPLWVKSGHLQCKTPCPLYPSKADICSALAHF